MIRFDSRGWRARYDGEFNEENVVRVADAAGAVWGACHPGCIVYVGYDTRRDAAHLAEAVAGTIAGHGLAVRLSSEAVPIPALGWGVAKDTRAVGGVMLTASEASAEYGGICLRKADGGPAKEDFVIAVEQHIGTRSAGARGSFEKIDLAGPFVQAALDYIGKIPSDRQLKVAVDPLYGSAGEAMRLLLEGLGCQVEMVHGERRSDFGGLRPSPREPWVEECKDFVVQAGADLGVVFDGDGDRLGVIDEKGEYVLPHVFECLLMEHLVKKRSLKGRVVVNQACSSLVTRQAERLGCPVSSVPVGFKRIYEEFSSGDVLLGCDHLGGISLPWHLKERDAIFAAGLLCSMMAEAEKPLSALVDEFESLVGKTYFSREDLAFDVGKCEMLRNFLPGVNPTELLEEEPKRISHTEGLKVELSDGSWVMVRPSRTEPVVRIWAEAPNEDKALELSQKMADGILGLGY